jgi:hypothetical protein
MLNGIFIYHSVGLFWVPGHSGILGNETAYELAREDSVPQFVGSEPALEVSRQNIKKIQCWLAKQHHTVGQSYRHSETGSRIDLGGVVLLLRLGYCPSMVHQCPHGPRWLLAFLLDITPSEDIST